MNAFLIIETQVFHIPETQTKIGRGLSNNLVISESQVSRQHAIIEREDDHFVIIDLDSTYGTFVNGKKVKKAALQSGDSILLANIPLVFVESAPHLEDKASMETGALNSKKGGTEEPTPVEYRPNWRKKDKE